MIQPFNLPPPSPHPADRGFPAFRDWLLAHADRLLNYLNTYNGTLNAQFNTLLNGYGPDIPSAGTITVRNSFHQVTGTQTISTIQQPTGQSASGTLCLYSKDGFAISGAGNVSPPQQVLPGGSVMLSYSPALKKWTGVASTSLLSGQGPDITATGTGIAITVTNMIHRITASPTISTINLDPTVAGDTGILILVAAGGNFTLQTGGNILLGGTLSVNHSAWLAYLPQQQVWTVNLG